MKRLAICAAVCAFVVGSSNLSSLTRLHLEWWGKIKGQNGSHIDGMVTMLANGDESKTQVDVVLKGDKPGASHPWSVRTGTCNKPGQIFGKAEWYKPLVADADGKSKSLTDIPLPVPDSGDFFITIHESSAKMRTIAACANMGLGD